MSRANRIISRIDGGKASWNYTTQDVNTKKTNIKKTIANEDLREKCVKIDVIEDVQEKTEGKCDPHLSEAY